MITFKEHDCKCTDSMHVRSNSNNMHCDDRSIIYMHECDKCNSPISNCQLCRTSRIFCKHRKVANRHRRECYQVTSMPLNTAEGNDIDELNEVNLAINGGFNMMEIELELQYVDFASNLNMEKDKFREFIKYFNKNTARKHLVAISQDKHNLYEGDVDLQIKLIKLHSELAPKQRLRLAEIIGLIFNSFNERESNNKLPTFDNISATNKLMQKNIHSANSP